MFFRRGNDGAEGESRMSLKEDDEDDGEWGSRRVKASSVSDESDGERRPLSVEVYRPSLLCGL